MSAFAHRCLAILVVSIVGVLLAVSPRAAPATDFTIILPQKAGGGTALFGTEFTAEMSKVMGTRIRWVFIPGQDQVKGPNVFHRDYKDDEGAMVAIGDGLSWLINPLAQYDFSEWEPIVIQPSNIAIFGRPGFEKDIRWAGGHIAQLPDIMAAAQIWGMENITYVPGYKGQAGRMAYLRGELNLARGNVKYFLKAIKAYVEKGESTLLFHHGLWNPKTGSYDDDPNLDAPTFRDFYRSKFGSFPSGPLYDAYKLALRFRGPLQGIFVHKGNPNKDRLIEAVRKVLADPEAKARLVKIVGDYRFLVGKEASDYMEALYATVEEEPLRLVVDWAAGPAKFQAVFKPDRVSR